MTRRRRIVVGFWVLAYLSDFLVLPALSVPYGSSRWALTNGTFALVVAAIWYFGMRRLAASTHDPKLMQGAHKAAEYWVVLNVGFALQFVVGHFVDPSSRIWVRLVIVGILLIWLWRSLRVKLS